MPWKEWNKVEERLRFVARRLDGEKMAGLCRDFGISRKTGLTSAWKANSSRLNILFRQRVPGFAGRQCCTA